MSDTSTPYDAALDSRDDPDGLATVDDELVANVAGYLWTVSKDPAPPREAIAAWLREEGTVEWNGAYARSAGSELRRWLEWMGSRSLGMDDLRRSGTRHLEAYAERLRSRVSAGGIAASTATNYFGYIRAALGWMVRHNELDTNPAEKDVVLDALPEDTSSRTDQQFWTPEQRERLLEHVSERAHDAVDADPRGQAARQALRDRALVGLLYFSAARVGEVARRRDDQRRGRDGLRWSEADLDRGVMEILGKGEQARISHAIPSRVVTDLRRHYRAQDPASDDWPVFPTGHAPSLWAAAREQLSGPDNDEDVDALVGAAGGIDAALREHGVTPPAITTDGVRARLRELCEAAGIDVDDQHGYLVPHGARRGAIGEVYKRDRGDAQDLGRHADLATTRAAYSHLEVEEQRDRLDDHFEAIDE